MGKQPLVYLVMRVFAALFKDVLPKVRLVEAAVEQAKSIFWPTQPFFSKILILVWENRKDFPTKSDCGKTFDSCRKRFQHLAPYVQVIRVTEGDNFVGAPNKALEVAFRECCDWLMFMSPEVYEELTPSVCSSFVRAIEKGARYVGVALPELGERGQRGFTGHTFGGWGVNYLWKIGGFDHVAAETPEHAVAPVVYYWDGTKITSVPLRGAEEVVTQARLVRNHGQCLAVIQPDPSVKRKPLAINTKFSSKQPRQESLLYARGFSPSLIEWGTLRIE